MKKHITLLGLCVSAVLGAYSQNWWQQGKQQSNNTDSDCAVYQADDPEIEIEYQYALGANNNNYARDIAFTPDSNGFHVLYAGNEYCLAKYNDLGLELWKKALVVNEDTIFYAKHFITIGSCFYMPGSWGDWPNTQYGIMKTDSVGNMLHLERLSIKKEYSRRVGYLDNPQILKVEDDCFLISFDHNDQQHIIKYDIEFNALWEFNNDDLEVGDAEEVVRLLYVNDRYLAYSHRAYWYISREGSLIKSDIFLGGAHYFLYHNNDVIHACGYASANAYWIRAYNHDLELQYEYLQDEDDYQFRIWWSESIKQERNGKVLVFYNFEYWGNDEMETNVNLLTLTNDLECDHIINFAGFGNQTANKLLIDKNGDYIIYGDGYYAPNNRNMLFLVKVKKWPTGIFEKPNTAELTIYPNPNNGVAIIEFNEFKSGFLEIFTVQGHMLKFENIHNQQEINIDASALNSGLYYIRFTSKDKIYSSKFIKE